MQFFAYHDVGGNLAEEKGDLRVTSPLGRGFESHHSHLNGYQPIFHMNPKSTANFRITMQILYVRGYFFPRNRAAL
jgi:hypothetical protein